MKTSLGSLSVLSLFCLLLLGCSQKSSLKDLEFKDGLYYLKGTTNLYSGKLESKYSSGKDSVIGSMKDGKYDGTITVYYENGNIKESIDYKLGEVISSKSYNENGQHICDCDGIYFNDIKGVWMTSNSEKVFDGTCISYWDNKNKKSSKVIKSGKERESYEWYENGHEKNTLIYDEDGKYKSKSSGYENGKPQMKEIFEDGILITLENWYENGNKCLVHHFPKEEYHNISLDGWYDDGKVAYHVESISDGRPMESTYTYECRTRTDFKTIFHDICRISNGKGKVYDKNGDWIVETFYENEKPIKVRRLPNNYNNREYIAEGSFKCVEKFGWLDAPSHYISEIWFYDKDPKGEGLADWVIQGENTTIEDAVNWYCQQWKIDLLK